MSITKTERVLNLVSLLLKTPHRPLPWAEIRDTVVGYAGEPAEPESLRRRFERDKRFLGELGIELEYLAGEGYRIAGASSPPPLSPTPDEVALLTLIASSHRSRRDTPRARHLQSALLKIRYDAPLDPPVVLGAIHVEDGPAAALETDRLDALGEATRLRQRVRFSYRGRSSGDDPTERRVEPWGLYARPGVHTRSWHVVGHCHRADAMRTFKVSRIVGSIEVEPPTDAFAPPEDLDLDALARRPAWAFAHPNPETVRAEVSFERAAFWRAARRHDALDVVEDDDGSGRAAFLVRDPDAFVRWILAFAGSATILSPPSLVARLVATVTSILDGLPAETRT